MSVHVISWVLENSDERLGRRLVLLVLADHARKDGTGAWPAIDTIAHEARMSRAQVIRCLGDLREAGSIVERGTTKSGTKIYDVVMGSHIATARGRISAERGSEDATRTVLKQPSVEPIAASPRNGHPRTDPSRRTKTELNAIWEALTHMFGAPTTSSATRLRGKITQELGQAGATADEILARGKRWPQHFDNATLTETALVNHWDRLGRKPLRAGR